MNNESQGIRPLKLPRNIHHVIMVTLLMLFIGIFLTLFPLSGNIISSLGVGLISSSMAGFLIYYYDQLTQRSQTIEHLLYIAINYVQVLQNIHKCEKVEEDGLIEDPREFIVHQYKHALQAAQLETVFTLSGKVWFWREKDRKLFYGQFIKLLYDPASELDVYFKRCLMTKNDTKMYYTYIIQEQDKFMKDDGFRLCTELDEVIPEIQALIKRVSTLVIFIKSKASVPSLAGARSGRMPSDAPPSLRSDVAILGYSPQSLRAEPPGPGLVRSGGLRPAALALATRAARPSPPLARGPTGP